MKITLLIALICTVFVTALNVVMTRHQARSLFVEIQQLEQTRDKLHEEWGRLQLEQSTWATDVRIESVAVEKLNMRQPDKNSLVLLQQ